MLLILMGKTCSGKDTVSKEIERRFGLKRIVTYTTRPKRTGEIDDVTYHFISDSQFDEKVKNNFFLEHKTYTTDFGTWKYGCSKEDILRANNNLIILTPDGVKDFIVEKNVLKIDINYKVVYLYANIDTIKKRLRKRGDAPAEAQRRISSDIKDFAGAELLADRIVYNNDGYDLEDVLAKIECVIKKGGEMASDYE